MAATEFTYAIFISYVLRMLDLVIIINLKKSQY